MNYWNGHFNFPFFCLILPFLVWIFEIGYNGYNLMWNFVTLDVDIQANPMKLVGRVKKIQDELSSLKDQCRQLLAAKQVYPLFFLQLPAFFLMFGDILKFLLICIWRIELSVVQCFYSGMLWNVEKLVIMDFVDYLTNCRITRLLIKLGMLWNVDKMLVLFLWMLLDKLLH